MWMDKEREASKENERSKMTQRTHHSSKKMGGTVVRSCQKC